MSYHTVLWYRRSCIILYWNIIACSIYYTILYVVFYGIELNWIVLYCNMLQCTRSSKVKYIRRFIESPCECIRVWPCQSSKVKQKRTTLASAGSEQILVDLLLNYNRKWKEMDLGLLPSFQLWYIRTGIQ